jgi:hypothetical protein
MTLSHASRKDCPLPWVMALIRDRVRVGGAARAVNGIADPDFMIL